MQIERQCFKLQARQNGVWGKLCSACQELQCRKENAVYPGSESYPLSKTTIALPLMQIRCIINDLSD